MESSNQASHSFAAPWRPITGLMQAVGIDFDFEKNKIFFSDVVERKLSWFYLNEENPQINNLIIQNGTNFFSSRNISQPDGIAYDWASDTIFWSDSRLKVVASLTINSGMRYVVASSEMPRAIVVHPCKGYLYWTDVRTLIRHVVSVSDQECQSPMGLRSGMSVSDGACHFSMGLR